jgi:hypothetical protein
MKISEDENSITLPNGIELVAEETDLEYPKICTACYFESNANCGKAPCSAGDREDMRNVLYRLKP